MVKRRLKSNSNEVLYNKRRQAYMKAAGYKVPLDGSWGPWQQSIWDKLTTRQKQYDTTWTGLFNGIVDKITGNTTYKVDPLEASTVRKYNPDEVDWDKTRRSQSKVVNALSGTWGPIVAAAMSPALAAQAIHAPLVTAATMAGGYAGGKLADKASETLTGRDIGTNVAMHSPLTPGMGDMLNPGYYYGAPRGAVVGDFLQTTLTGKSTKSLKPITREYLGKPYYDNIEPMGYGNSLEGTLPRNTQVRNMFIDFLKPRFLRNNVSDPNYTPKWYRDKNNPEVLEVFRNDAHRLSMGLEPHQELLPDGKLHSLYVEKPNGKYDVDWDYIRHVKQNYANRIGLSSDFFSDDFPTCMTYESGSPTNGQVVAKDMITTNGGLGTYTFDPNVKLTNLNPIELMSSGDITFTDTWDVQPVLDGRTYWPWLTKSMTSLENKNIPVLSKMGHNIKNTELVDAFGGTPFTQETIIPNKRVFWTPTDENLEQRYARDRANNNGNWETLNW